MLVASRETIAQPKPLVKQSFGGGSIWVFVDQVRCYVRIILRKKKKFNHSVYRMTVFLY